MVGIQLYTTGGVLGDVRCLIFRCSRIGRIPTGLNLNKDIKCSLSEQVQCGNTATYLEAEVGPYIASEHRVVCFSVVKNAVTLEDPVSVLKSQAQNSGRVGANKASFGDGVMTGAVLLVGVRTSSAKWKHQPVVGSPIVQ